MTTAGPVSGSWIKVDGSENFSVYSPFFKTISVAGSKTYSPVSVGFAWYGPKVFPWLSIVILCSFDVSHAR